MKKGRRIHPCLPAVEDRLAALPVAVAALAAALPAEDREVLAYLLFIGCNAAVAGGEEKRGSNKGISSKKTAHHVPRLDCTCFACYTSFWARWDASPNRHVIHRALEAFEETVAGEEAARKPRRRRRKSADVAAEEEEEEGEVQQMEKATAPRSGNDDNGDDDGGGGVDDDDEEDDKNSSSLKKLMSFIGEKVWGGWKN